MKTTTIFSLTALLLFLTSCSSRKYVNYLKEQTEVIKMQDTLQFNSLDDAFYKNKLFLFGEVHEVKTSPRIDFAMFTQLHNKANASVYLAEMDIAQGYYLNEYIKGSNTIPLKTLLKEWVVYIGSISEDFRTKWKQMRAYYNQLPTTSKFKLVGIDRIADFNLLHMLLKEKLPKAYYNTIPKDKDALINWSNNRFEAIIEKEQYQLDSETVDLLKNIQFNLSNYKTTKHRDVFMHKNFKRLYAQNQWKNKTIYGGFGFAHTLQAYNYTLAGLIKKDTTLPYSNQMVSINTLYVDSKLTVESNSLPRFMQDKGKRFTKFKYSQDNRLFMYIKGIADYKKVTKPNTISLIKLDANGSPYSNSTRGTKVKKLITIWDAYDIKEGTNTTDYAQYILFVRNADWIKPDEL